MPKPKQQVQNQNPPTYYLFLLLLLVGFVVIAYLLFSWATEDIKFATAQEVQQIVTQYEYEQQEFTDPIASENPKIKILSSDWYVKEDIQIKFYVTEDDDSSRVVYHYFCDVFNTDYNNAVGDDLTNARANFMQRQYKKDGKLFYLMKISNTVLYIEGPQENANEIYSIAEALGYVPEF